ncbi:Pyruvate/2-oxoglutarate/acetoin dehydrogenase complex, dehydrogenase (E1) component [Flavobacterium glycines]|uniref:3-methyl-2-oxobutanoate dehydrogenase (2-methylpropanoyl-transferring) n=1 Tax=Flavobacterium glycines TaxID=551990 RepID=A0A1B9DZ66_9FLAO|nr:alpha-ketoacid dehydrogenase subunit alpha/beta [Flavobacterium glycines]OCB74970.1 transketolase [Flavobacterium glycines]GEL11256.1 transketolase [Flavobacterium glycines]SDJ44605.1 Pyruvate/2-oxoglutarate/acetoin dehydrogenase complex, dehydrogenase (E1) component [Flavobacterium glycines]
MIKEQTNTTLTFEDFKTEVLNDYKIAVTSRECSLLGRREVLTGKAKFGIFGDGKEVPQIAMAKFFKNGDFRSGYYRDQTFMMAIGELTTANFFAGLYGNTDIKQEPMSAGRQMGGHFVTHSLNEDGSWKNLTKQKNSSSDISPTAAQMPRLLGLAQASKVYREINIPNQENFSINGNEVAWGTIGNASTSEGVFFETINAAGVLQVPMVISIWDDEYGISVHAKHQTTKENISEILSGFQRDKNNNGLEIITVKGWDYSDLITAYERASKIAREKHIPVLVHVTQLTQPQGHSSSGSHERYKSSERLNWEREFDCIRQMRLWMIAINIASAEELNEIENSIKKEVLETKKESWTSFITPIVEEKNELIALLEKIAPSSKNKDQLLRLSNNLKAIKDPLKKEILVTARKSLRLMTNEAVRSELSSWIQNYFKKNQPLFSNNLYSETKNNVFSVKEVLPTYAEGTRKDTDGRMIIRDNFDALFAKHPEVLIFGEDSGNIGDVNQGLEGMQEKYGETRVADTGIREATIIGQGIGLALRGLRPIAEIQYLDYLLYAIQILSDDLASLLYRTAGKQNAPLIIRTRGHRLEGIWHSGSPMGMIINAIRGINVLVPRDMTKAAGFYNSLLECNEPALVIECLNGYRLKEKAPNNFGEFKTPIGVVETIKTGTDITLVSYGSTLRLVEQAAKELLEIGIDCEVIDIQSLIPFDKNHDIAKSVQKTNRLLVIDEDVPGGASAYILQKIIEEQDAYQYLDSKPQTLSAQEHRPAYGTDGDYFSKPSIEDIYEKVYSIISESNPTKYPKLY